MTASLARALLTDDRSKTLRRGERAVLGALAHMATDDGQLRWPVRTAKLVEKTGYSEPTIKRGRRRLTELGLIAHQPGTGRDVSRYAVSPSWDQLHPEITDQQPAARRERPKVAVERLPELAPYGTEWLPEPPEDEEVPPPIDDVDQADEVDVDQAAAVVELRPDPAEVPDPPRSEWCTAARAEGRPHRGRRCCGMTPRAMQRKANRAAADEARRREAERFAAEYGPAPRRAVVHSEDAADRLAAARAALRAQKGEAS